MTDTVLVTGGTGFVAGHVVAAALDAGLDVRATVRDPDDGTKVAPLLALVTGRPGRLTLHRADLLQPGSFDEAVDGCRYVMHVASPFLVSEQMTDPERQVVAPAVQGTRTVLDAVEGTPSVEQVVLTSTVGAKFGDYVDELFRGEFWYGAPDVAFTLVDVRDLAAAHVAAAVTPTAHGRYVLAREQMVTFHDMARIVRRTHPRRRSVPRHRLPHAAVRALGPRFGLTPRYIRGHLGVRFEVDGRLAERELGVVYRPVEETVLDTYDSWAVRAPGRGITAPAAGAAGRG